GVRENLAAGLAERLGMHWCWADASKWRDSEGEELSIGNAILSRWPIAAQAQTPLPAEGLADERRVAVHAMIDAPGGAPPMFTPPRDVGRGRLSGARGPGPRAGGVGGRPRGGGRLPAGGRRRPERRAGFGRTAAAGRRAHRTGGRRAGADRRVALRRSRRPRLHLGPPQRLPGPQRDPRLTDRLHPGRLAPAGPRQGAVRQPGRYRPGDRRLAVGSLRGRRGAPALAAPAGVPRRSPPLCVITHRG